MIAASEAEQKIKEIYASTEKFYKTISSVMGEKAAGYEILYGPPFVHAPILFVGINPGGSREPPNNSEAAGSMSKTSYWPPECEYATENWDLARALRNIFDPVFLKQCTGLNVNFFRSGSVETWNLVPPDVIKEAETFSLCRVKQIIEILDPQSIITIGFDPFEKLRKRPSAVKCELKNDQRILVKSGIIFEKRLLAMRHLSASRRTIRPTHDEIVMIKEFMATYG